MYACKPHICVEVRGKLVGISCLHPLCGSLGIELRLPGSVAGIPILESHQLVCPYHTLFGKQNVIQLLKA